MKTRTLSPEKTVSEAVRNSTKLENRLRGLLLYKKIVTGQGLEFNRLREYVPGDEAKMIDWSSLAKTGKLYTRIFEEERMLNVMIAQDVSSTMATGTREILKNEYASIVSTTLAKTAIEAGDKSGFIAFSEGKVDQIPASYSEDMPFQVADRLSDRKVYGGEKDWEGFAEELVRQGDSQTFLFLISDFIPFNQEAEDMLREVSEAYRGFFVIMVRDPLDFEMPEGVGRTYVADPETGEKVLIDMDDLRERYIDLNVEREEKLKKSVESSGGLFFKTRTDTEFVEDFARFIDRESELWN